MESKGMSCADDCLTLIDAVPDIAYELDADGKFTFVSRAVNGLGYAPDDLVGRHFSEIIHPDDYHLISRVIVLPKFAGKVTGAKFSPGLFDERRCGMRKTENLKARFALKGKDADYVLADVSSSGRWDRSAGEKDKLFLGSVGVIHSASSHDGAQKEKQETGRKESEYVATVAHELRTPLAIAKEGIGLVLDGTVGGLTRKQKKILAAVSENVGRLIRITSSLLDISKIESGRLELTKSVVDISGLVERLSGAFKKHAKDKRIKIETSLPKYKIRLYADADKIVQVLTNLLDNAVKFTPSGGRVAISCSLCQPQKCGKKEGGNKTGTPPGAVSITVTDTGVGIAKENLDKIFDRFQQIGDTASRKKGAGLGLSIVRAIVQMHGGTITVGSGLGLGTTFKITLPQCTDSDMMKDRLGFAVREAETNDAKMSLVIVSLPRGDKSFGKIGRKKVDILTDGILDAIKKSLHRSGDFTLKMSGRFFIMLPACDRGGALIVIERLQKVLDFYLAKQSLPRKIGLKFDYVIYPDDAGNLDKLFSMAGL